jgi:hypothetical protein
MFPRNVRELSDYTASQKWEPRIHHSALDFTDPTKLLPLVVRPAAQLCVTASSTRNSFFGKAERRCITTNKKRVTRILAPPTKRRVPVVRSPSPHASL